MGHASHTQLAIAYIVNLHAYILSELLAHSRAAAAICYNYAYTEYVLAFQLLAWQVVMPSSHKIAKYKYHMYMYVHTLAAPSWTPTSTRQTIVQHSKFRTKTAKTAALLSCPKEKTANNRYQKHCLDQLHKGVNW